MIFVCKLLDVEANGFVGVITETGKENALTVLLVLAYQLFSRCERYAHTSFLKLFVVSVTFLHP